MPREVLLLDCDSIIPNLPLMKLSRFHKNLGDKVTLQRGLVVSTQIDHPDIVYISCVFAENKDATRKLALQFPGAEVRLGGSGMDLTTELPMEIEHLMPDYDLYDCDTSYGFTMRGCIRNCGFCVVPTKEGKAHPTADIYEFWDRRHSKVTLFDNNILALPEHFELISNQILKENLMVDWNQGLDIRLVNDWNAEILSRLRISPLRFAFDNIKSEPQVRRGLEILRAHGINRALWYVLVGFDSSFEEDMHRLEVLKELKQVVYVMRYETVRKKHEYIRLAMWANQPHIFAKMPFEEFKKRRNELHKKNYLKNEADIFQFGKQFHRGKQ